MTEHWHVFCRVVDNYGDAGVSWRLARQLAAEHRIAVTLWIDRLATLAAALGGEERALALRADIGDRAAACHGGGASYGVPGRRARSHP